MFRVFIADDHSIFRAGLQSVLTSARDFQLVGEATTGKEALETILRLQPDLAVLDVEMPGLGGIEVARQLRDARSPTQVLILSVHGSGSFVQAALEASARGYLVKQDAGEELVTALRSIARGEVYLSPRVAGAAVQAMRDQPLEPRLTKRERDVVRLLSEGLSSKEIAGRLGLTPKTVDGYRSAIMAKLGVRNVAGLVRYALTHHLTTSE